MTRQVERSFNIATVCLLGSLALAGCNKSDSASSSSSSTQGTQDKPASSAATAPTEKAGDKPASAGATATGDSASVGAWGGTYKSVAGTLYIPRDVPNAKDWASVKWQGETSPLGLGEGAISLTVEGNRVSGTLEGPLGPAVLSGAVTNGQLTATISRKDTSDRGFTGTAIGKMEGGKVEGTMQLALADADVLRNATFSLTKK